MARLPLLAAFAAAVMFFAGCCTNKPASEQPSTLDRAADVVVPLAKGYLCGQAAPPDFLPDAAWVDALWAATQALVCTDPAPPTVAGAPAPTPVEDAP